MMALAAAALISLMTLAIAWVVYLYVLPRWGQLMCIYRLHALRDRVFNVGVAFPRARRTLVYRDIDGFIASSIYMVRDGTVTDALKFLVAISPRKSTKRRSDWRAEQLHFELQTVFSEPDARLMFKELISAAEQAEKMVVYRVLSGHLAVFCGALVGFLVGGVVLVVRRLVSSAVDRARRISNNLLAADIAEVNAINDVIVRFGDELPALKAPKLQAPRVFYNRVTGRHRVEEGRAARAA